MTSSGVRRRLALFETSSQPSSTATGASAIICQSMSATRPSSSERDVGELEVAVERRSPAAGRARQAAARDRPTAAATRSRARGGASRSKASQPVEEPVADGEALGAIALGRRPRQQQQPLAQRTPRPVPVGGRRAGTRPRASRAGVRPRRGRGRASRRRAAGRSRDAPRRSARSTGRASGSRSPSPSRADPEVRRDERLDERAAGRRRRTPREARCRASRGRSSRGPARSA